MSGMFVIKDDETNTLVEMTEQAYDSEDVLQTLLAKYPNLLAGDQMNSDDPRTWLPITREVPLPSEQGGAARWSVDHLFLDQDGIPTIVEVKRSTDTRIRREVIGQMLDYAANAVVYWGIEHVRAHYESNCAANGIDAEQQLIDFLAGRCEPEAFWMKVKTNLEAGKVRMVFVADIIPPELQRIVEFLNTQMNPAEVLAVQIKQYTGQGLKTLVPRVIGLTAAATEKKQYQWDESSFMAAIENRFNTPSADAARKMLSWAKDRNLRIWWGKGAKDGSFFPMFDWRGENHFTFSVWTYGRVEMQFQGMKSRPPFDTQPMRLELLKRLNTIDGIKIPTEAITRRPSIPIEVLSDKESLDQFLGIFDWVVSEIRKT